MARQFAEKVSFIFVLKWLQQKSKKSPLHQSNLKDTGDLTRLQKITDPKQILSMCYF